MVTPQFGRPPKTSIRFQLLLAVNGTLAVLVGVLLAYDYASELAERFADKRVALEEEAKTLLPAIERLRHHGIESVQHYIDAVCGRMRDAESPWHHIAVHIDQDTLQASAHHRASPEILRAMEKAAQSPRRLAPFRNTELIVGAHRRDRVAVYVSETLDTLRQGIWYDVIRRLAGVVLLALATALVINVVLIRIVTRPLSRLVTIVQQIGRGRLGIQARDFRSAELNFLADEINAMSTALSAAQRDRAAQLGKARQIQEHLLPADCAIPGLNVARLFQPADIVAGDFYDILPLADKSWLFCVADVTGHGVPAAMSASMVKALLLQATEHLTSPADILQYLNHRFLAVSLLGDFVTMLLARTSARSKSVQYASAGHEPGWLLGSNGSPHELASTGLVLGVDEDEVWQEETIHVATGDRLFMVTDGVTETFNGQGELYGRQRLGELLDDCGGLALDEAVQRINQVLVAFRDGSRLSDDLTVLAVEIDGVR